MLVEHLKKRNSFKAVVTNRKDTADYYVTGNLTKFYGKQNFSTAALVGTQFGAIGAIATAGAKSKGKIILERDFFDNLEFSQQLGLISR